MDLITACMSEDREAVYQILNRNLDFQDKDGVTAIHTACRWFSEIVPLLLERGANPRLKNNQDKTTLHFLVSGNSCDSSIVSLLLANGVDVNAVTTSGKSALWLACESHPHIVPLLLQHGADPTLACREGIQPIHLACRYDASNVQRLHEAGASVHAITNSGCTTLHYACQYQPQVVPFLLQEGVDPNAVSDNEWTPFLKACFYHPETIPLMKTANLSIQGPSKKTALHFVCESKAYVDPSILTILVHCGLETKSENGYTALQFACRFQPLLVPVMIQMGADVNAESPTRITPLLIACEYQPSIVELLIQAGARIQRDNNGSTPLQTACKFQPNAVPFILKHTLNVNEADNLGWTALHFAAKYQPSVMKLLIDKGADPQLRNGVGRTPFDYGKPPRSDTEYTPSELGPCVVCLVKTRAVMLNCGHFVMCHACSKVDQCPICRVRITSRLDVFM
jgi:ankyrin repeat protein